MCSGNVRPYNPAIHWLLFILVLLFCGLVMAALAVWVMARLILKPPRMTDAKAVWLLKRLSPGDLGLPFTPLSFRVRDGQNGRPLNLAAWWIGSRQDSDRCAILLHGYADAKVGAIAWAPLLHGLGYNVLALDLPGHGESDYRPVSCGYWERHLIAQVIDQLRSDRPRQARTIVLYGLSYGALVAAATAALRDDIAGVVLDSPPISAMRAAAVHYELAGLPGWPLRELAAVLAARLARADWSRMHLPSLVPQICCGLLVIECDEDPFMLEGERRELELAMQRRRDSQLQSEYLFIPEARHLLGIQVEPERYAQAVGSFLPGID